MSDINIWIKNGPEALQEMQKAFAPIKNFDSSFSATTKVQHGDFGSRLGFYFEACVLNGVLQAAKQDPDVISSDAFTKVNFAADKTWQNQNSTKAKLFTDRKLSGKEQVQLQQAALSAQIAGQNIWNSILGPKFKEEIQKYGEKAILGAGSIGGSSSVGDLGFKVGDKRIIIECKFWTLDQQNPGSVTYFTLSDATGNFPMQFWAYLKQSGTYWPINRTGKAMRPAPTQGWANVVLGGGFEGYVNMLGGGSKQGILNFILAKGGKASAGISGRYLVSGGKQTFAQPYSRKAGAGSTYRTADLKIAAIRNNRLNANKTGNLKYSNGAFHIDQRGLNVGITGNLLDMSNQDIYGNKDNENDLQLHWGSGSVSFITKGKQIGTFSISDKKTITENSVFNQYKADGKGWTTHFAASMTLNWIHNLT